MRLSTRGKAQPRMMVAVAVVTVLAVVAQLAVRWDLSTASAADLNPPPGWSEQVDDWLFAVGSDNVLEIENLKLGYDHHIPLDLKPTWATGTQADFQRVQDELVTRVHDLLGWNIYSIQDRAAAQGEINKIGDILAKVDTSKLPKGQVEIDGVHYLQRTLQQVTGMGDCRGRCLPERPDNRVKTFFYSSIMTIFKQLSGILPRDVPGRGFVAWVMTLIGLAIALGVTTLYGELADLVEGRRGTGVAARLEYATYIGMVIMGNIAIEGLKYVVTNLSPDTDVKARIDLVAEDVRTAAADPEPVKDYDLVKDEL
jgi:hypothetical protein